LFINSVDTDINGIPQT